MTKRYTLWFQVVLAFLLFAGLLGAQGTRGTITGTVHDASGAVVPGVKITVANAQTGQHRASQTASSGAFRSRRSRCARWGGEPG